MTESERKGATMPKTANTERPVMICTAKRGVFFGYTDEPAETLITRGTGTLRNARMCTYWSKETHGVMGLAGIGPQKGSRVGPRVPDLTVESITAVVGCSDAAVTAWESETWT